MRRMDYYFTYRTRFGVGAVIGDDFGIKYHLLPETDTVKLFNRIRESALGVLQVDETLKSALEAYFNGSRVNIKADLNLSGYSEFTKEVYARTAEISYAHRATYSQIAVLAGSPKGQRAVGNALNKNRFPVFIPCHRVIKADGRCGGWGGKPGWKERLLKLETS